MPMRIAARSVVAAALAGTLLAGCSTSSSGRPAAQSPLLTGPNEGAMYIGEGNTPDSCGWTWQRPPADEAANLAAWHFNSVRLHISWANLEPTAPTVGGNGALVHHWNDAYVDAITAAVDDFRDHGISTIAVFTQSALSPAFKKYDTAHKVCEGSGMPAWLYPDAAHKTYPDGWCEFYANRPEHGVPIKPQDGLAEAERFFAAHFAADRGLYGIDMINEPNSVERVGCQGTATGLTKIYEKLGRAIRSSDPKVTLVFEDTNSYQTLGTALDGPPALSNLMFSVHTYDDDWPATQAVLARAVAQAKQWHVPLWIGEFDAFNADDNTGPPVDSNWKADLQAMMRYCHANRIGWSIQNYDADHSLIVPKTRQGKQELISILQEGR